MNKLLLLLIVLLAASASIAQETNKCPCCFEPYRQFDYWIGSWDVYDTLGTQVGTNVIDKLQDGCVLRENWIGVKGGTGTSYNFYSRIDSTWNQVWIDNQGGILRLTGNTVKGNMILKSAPSSGQQGNIYFHEIRWIKNPDGTITQLWTVRNENDEILNTIFKGIYKSKANN